MKNIRRLFLGTLSFFVMLNVYADSPLIRTSFFTAYYLNEKVQYAEEIGFLDGAIGSFLTDQSVSVDLKAAVINALPWKDKGNNNIVTFRMFIGRKYGKSFDSLNNSELTADELFCLGYMTMLNNLKELPDALILLMKAKAKSPESFTINMFYSLAVAQDHLNNSRKCDAWTVCDHVRNDASLNRDLNQDAVALIFEQVNKYKINCD